MAEDSANVASGRTDDFLQRAYALSGIDAAKDLYDEWASSYDNDLDAMDYASPKCAVDAVIENLDLNDSDTTKVVEILDAGCGTGLVGVCLERSRLEGRFAVDGLDLSPAMLTAAREKGIYRELELADLNSPLRQRTGSYDVALCVGTLTKGHVGAQLFGELVRVTRKAGLVVATVHDEIWESGGYRDEVESLSREGTVEILSTAEFGIVKGSTKGGRMVQLKKR